MDLSRAGGAGAKAVGVFPILFTLLDLFEFLARCANAFLLFLAGFSKKVRTELAQNYP
jgi:hypothetical protein